MVAASRFLGSVALLCFSLAAFAEERETLSDFEKGGLADQFVAVRQITLAREPIAANAPANGPAGHAVAARTAGNAALFSKPLGLKKNLLNASDIEFWVYRPAAEKDRASTIEVQFLEADAKARFWRKVDLDHVGWRKISLPLRWFQWGEGRIPRWDRVDRWGVLFRNRAEVQIDEVKLVRQADPDIALPQPEDLRTLAFPMDAEKQSRLVSRGDILLATNAPDLEVDKLANHLLEVKKQVAAELQLPAAPPWPAPMIVFQTRAEYEAFPPQLAAKLNGAAAAPRSTGYTIQGIATSFWDPQFGSLRPVYTHEFVHAILSREVSLPNRNDWFQEGLAVHYQLQFHPQADFGQIVRQGIADPAFRAPLAELASGKAIQQNRYWQAATLVELLLKDKKYQPQFGPLIRALAESGSTDLGPQLPRLYKVDWEELTTNWRKYCEAAYAPK